MIANKSVAQIMFMLREWTAEEGLKELEFLASSADTSGKQTAIVALARDFNLKTGGDTMTTLRKEISDVANRKRIKPVWTNEWLLKQLSSALYLRRFKMCIAIINGQTQAKEIVSYLDRQIDSLDYRYPLADGDSMVALLYFSNFNHYEPVAIQDGRAWRFAVTRAEAERQLHDIWFHGQRASRRNAATQ